MDKSFRIFQLKQERFSEDTTLLSALKRTDICFYRFIGGNSGETEDLLDHLTRLKETRALLIGIFRFPFRFEGKKRLQIAVEQYHHMKELCDAVTYIQSEGILDVLQEGTSIQDAQKTFAEVEEAPVKAVQEMIQRHGEMNIDMQDIRQFVKEMKGPLFIRTIEGDAFEEPLKYTVSAPYLPQDFGDGERMIVNIGYAKDVDMEAFRQINLRINDLFHKADLVKLGTYYLDEPGNRFRITLIVKNLKDPYPLEKRSHRWTLGRFKIKRLSERLGRSKIKKRLVSALFQEEESDRSASERFLDKKGVIVKE